MSSNRIGVSTLDEEVSGVVRAEMGRSRIGQSEMARAIGMHQNVFGRKYRGESKFSSSELAAIAHKLNLTAATLTAEAERRFFSAALAEPSRADDPVGTIDVGPVVVEPEPAPAVEAHGVAAVERVGAALAGVPAEALLEHEAACDSCWSLDDAARHLSGDEDPATHRASDEEVA